MPERLHEDNRMGLMQRIRKLLPAGLRQKLRVRDDRIALRRIAKQPCDPGLLGALSQAEVDGIFRSDAIGDDWESVSPRIDDLGIPRDRGGVNAGDRRAVYYLIKHFKPTSVLEIGTHIGASTAHIAAALAELKAAGDVPSPRFVTVDLVDVNDPATEPWRAWGIDRPPRDNIARMGGEAFVEFLARRSLDYLNTCGQKFDFIFLDGDHAAPNVYQEIPAALKCLSPGGRVLLHDFFPNCDLLWPGGALIPGVYLGIERLRSEGAAIRALPLGELPWPTKLGMNVTSLAMLSKDA